MHMIKSVILIGGPYKRGNFTPFDMPAPLIPVAGLAMICHHLFALSRVPGLRDVFLYGYYDRVQLMNFISQRGSQIGLNISYIEEPRGLGTGGALAKEIENLFKDSEDLIVLHSDICCDFPLKEIYEWHKKLEHNPCTLVTTKVKKDDERQYGYLVKDEVNQELIHHAEKPDRFHSEWINCGMYFFNRKFKDIFTKALEQKFERIAVQKEKQPFLNFIQTSTSLDPKYLSLERDIIAPQAGSGKIFLWELDGPDHFWLQIKTTKDILKANATYLNLYQNAPIIFNVFRDFVALPNQVLVHTTANVSQKAKLGPYVVIGAGVKIHEGVRIHNSIIQAGVEIKSFTYISDSIIGYNSTIGYWCRIEGSDKVTVLGVGVQVENEVCIRDSIALPNKKIQRNHDNDHIV